MAAMICLTVVVFNPGLVRAPLEGYLSDTAGYPVRLEGDLKVRPGAVSTVTARNVHVSAPDWSREPDLLAISDLEIKLATATLFGDTIVIESLVVEGLELNLETDAEGNGNWISANEAPVEDTGDTGGGNVVFANIAAGDAAFRFRNASKNIEHVFNIVALKHQQADDGMLHTSLNGDLNGRPVEYTSIAGPYDNLLKGRDINITAAGQFGQLAVSAEAYLDDLLEPRLPEFDITLQGPDTDEITAMLGVDDLGSGAFSLRAVGGGQDGSFVAKIDGDLGDILLNASLSASDITQLGSLDMNIAANGPSLGAMTSLVGIDNLPDKPFSLKGDVERVGSTLNISGLALNIGGTRLTLDALMSNFPSLDSSRIKLAVTGDEISQFQELLGLPELATGPFDLMGNLDVSLEGVERINVELQTSLGQGTLSGTLGMDPGYAGSKLRLHLDGPSARSIMSLFNVDALPEQPFNLNAGFEIVEGGMHVERGVLVTIDDDRLELGGFVAFSDGGRGTNLELKVGGQSFPQVLNQLAAGLELPDMPYEVAGQVSVLDDGLQLKGFEGNYGSIKLNTGGIIRFSDGAVGSELALGISGDDLHAWKSFAALGDTLDMFVTGQPFTVNGTLLVEESGWRINSGRGQIGKTNFGFDGLVGNQDGLAGTQVRFSIDGPGLNDLLSNQDENAAVIGAFESSGLVSILQDTLSIKGFRVEGEGIFADVNVSLDWPASEAMNADFDIDVRGDDLRPFLPAIDGFQPAILPYDVKIAGRQKKGLLGFDKFDATLGGLKLLLTGDLAGEAENESVNVTFHLASQDLSTLGLVKGDPLPALGLDLSADLSGNLRDIFLIRNLQGSLGESRLRGSADVSLEGPKPKFNLVVQSELIDLRPFLGPAGSADEADEVTEARNSEKKTRLIPPTPLPLSFLDAVDFSMKLEVAELQFRSDSMKNLGLEAELIDRILNVPRIALEGPRGSITSAFSVEPTSATHANIGLDLTTTGLVLNLSGQPDSELHLVPAFDIGIQATGNGSNMQELAGSLNGSLYLVSEGGKLKGINLSILDTFILDELFGLLLPKSDKEDNLKLECAATLVTMTDGLLSTEPALAFTTDLIAVVAKGTLDLKTEKMHFNFNATPNNALKISASELVNPYILVGGTLAKPSVGLDPGKVLVQGGLAVGTAGISMLAKGLLDRVGNTVPLCEKMQKQVEQQQ